MLISFQLSLLERDLSVIEKSLLPDASKSSKYPEIGLIEPLSFWIFAEILNFGQADPVTRPVTSILLLSCSMLTDEKVQLSVGKIGEIRESNEKIVRRNFKVHLVVCYFIIS